jgi:hypothetical protein
MSSHRFNAARGRRAADHDVRSFVRPLCLTRVDATQFGSGGDFCAKNRLYRNDRFLTQRGQSAKGQPLLIEVEFSERIVRGACGAPSAPLVVSATVAYLLPVHRKKR